MIDDLQDEAVLPPLPVLTEETRPFWESCKENVMKMQRCSHCSKFRFPPSVICPFCSSMDYSWQPVSGEGNLFSYVTFHRLYHKAFTSLLPYVVVLVELNEGPRMISRLSNSGAYESLNCGSKVRVCFEKLNEDLTLPLFELVDI